MTGHLQSANSLLPKIKTFNLPETFDEEARLLWLKVCQLFIFSKFLTKFNRRSFQGEQDAATNCLIRGIQPEYRVFIENKFCKERRKGFAKVLVSFLIS